MNRLIIIGNGFDLAHGLPTSYRDFIDDYWSNVIEFLKTNNYFGDGFISINVTELMFDFWNREPLKNILNFKELFEFLQKNKCQIVFQNNFFKIVNELNGENWVDIENEYYYQLKKIIKTEGTQNKKVVEELNIEFEAIKNILEDYLFVNIENKYIRNDNFYCDVSDNSIFDQLKPISIHSNQDKIFKEFVNINDVKEIKEHFQKEKNEELTNYIHFVNFNYTSLINNYCSKIKYKSTQSSVNFIHGSLSFGKTNKINFGFGDEMDEDYKSIENYNENEYLKNFKSFQYLQNSNYRDLLNYINSEKFQVYIMGHSCGLSDRTLLNTIFEHENCRSIKIYYHEKKDENGKVISDNYTEITQNISRHFNKKKLMREKIVNKTLCTPLPQIQLPKKV